MVGNWLIMRRLKDADYICMRARRAVYEFVVTP
jgi:hypothetical protein